MLDYFHVIQTHFIPIHWGQKVVQCSRRSTLMTLTSIAFPASLTSLDTLHLWCLATCTYVWFKNNICHILSGMPYFLPLFHVKYSTFSFDGLGCLFLHFGGIKWRQRKSAFPSTCFGATQAFERSSRKTWSVGDFSFAQNPHHISIVYQATI